MKIANRIDMTITNARMTRMTKTRALTGGGRKFSGIQSASDKNAGIRTLLDQLLEKENKTSATEKLIENQQKSYDYSVIKQSAGRVQEHMEKLAAVGDQSIFGQADKIKAKEQAVSEIVSTVKDYNVMFGKLNQSKDLTDIAYARKMKETVQAYTKELKTLGIEVGSDGRMSVDTNELKKADLESMKKIFGTGSGLSGKLLGQMELIGKNAEKKIEELKKSSYQASMNYTRYGTDSLYGSGQGNRYNAKG